MTSNPVTHRPPSTPSAARPAAPPRPRNALLWVALGLGVAADVAASVLLTSPWASSAGGLVMLVCVVALVLRTRAARAHHAGRVGGE